MSGTVRELKDPSRPAVSEGELPVAATIYAFSVAAGGYFIRTLSQLLAKERMVARLNPHFLFNSLQNISVMARQDSQTASRMLTRLGDPLHAVLRQDTQPESALHEEIELTRAYVALEHRRFGDRLNVAFEIGWRMLRASLALSCIAALPLTSQDWPMWGGTAQRNMTSTMRGLPETWDAKNGTNIKWKAQIGSSSNGNPVVADGKVFLGTNNGNPRNPGITGDKGVLMCLRESDGSFLWQAVTDKLDGERDWPEEGVCSSPAVEGKRLYYVSNRGELICLDTEGFTDGKNDGPFQNEVYKGPTDADIVWKLDMREELGVAQLFMAASSPVVWDDLVFVATPNGRDSNDEKVLAPKAPSFLAVDKNTGKVAWQDNSPGESILHGQWSSAALGTVDGAQQAIFPGGDGWLYGFNARTGENLWKFDLNPKDAVWPKTRNYGISTPVFSGGQVFMSVGQDPDHPNGVGHTYCINPALRGDITDSGRVWQYDKIGRSISTAAVADGLVYVADMKGLLHCLDVKTGKPNWTFDMMAPVWGSPLVADGKVYLGDQDGDVAVLRTGPEMKKIAEIDMGNTVYSTPVPANGVLYVMTRTALYAIASGAGGYGK